jgi:galacturonosyltransferase
MRILIFSNIDAGLVKFRYELIQTLVKKYSVIVAVPNGQYINELTKLGTDWVETTVDRRSINPVSNIKYYFKCKKVIDKVKPNIILTYTVKPNIFGGMAAKNKKIPYIATITGLGTGFKRLTRGLIVYLYKNALSKCANVVFQNEENKDIFIKLSIINKEKVIIVPGSGVNIDHYQFREMPKAPIQFIYAARIMKEKGADELFAAAKRIKQEFPDVCFIVLGWFEENYKLIIDSLEQEAIIKYRGYVDDVAPYIYAAHCVVLPSYHEGMSNVLLEGAAMGRALITSNIPGCREAVEDGVNGFLCKPKDTESLYICLKRFIHLSHAERQEMGKASRRIIEDRFNRKVVTEKMLQIIDKCMGL